MLAQEKHPCQIHMKPLIVTPPMTSDEPFHVLSHLCTSLLLVIVSFVVLSQLRVRFPRGFNKVHV